MTPMICDMTGQVVEPRFEPKKGPILGRDYFMAYNRILSIEGMQKIEEIVWETMKSRGFGKYHFLEHKKIFKAVVEQYCNRSKNVYNKNYRVAQVHDYNSPVQPHW